MLYIYGMVDVCIDKVEQLPRVARMRWFKSLLVNSSLQNRLGMIGCDTILGFYIGANSPLQTLIWPCLLSLWDLGLSQHKGCLVYNNKKIAHLMTSSVKW